MVIQQLSVTFGSFMKRRSGFFMLLKGVILTGKTQAGIIRVCQLGTFTEMSRGNTEVIG